MAQDPGSVRRWFRQMSAADQYTHFKDWQTLRGYALGELAIAPVGRVTLYDTSAACRPELDIRDVALQVHEHNRLYWGCRWVQGRRDTRSPRLNAALLGMAD